MFKRLEGHRPFYARPREAGLGLEALEKLEKLEPLESLAQPR